MPIRFMAIKIHYDHRTVLPHYLKYSMLPTQEEYDEYLELFNKEGIGGQGFHECLNYQIPEGEDVKIYLPPTSHPSDEFAEDEFVIFSFTYKFDQEMPACVIGVHANVTIADLEGIERPEHEWLEGVEPFIYHAEAPAEYVTLMTPPLEYDCKDGDYTPVYRYWGYGLRYITEQHAENIVRDSLRTASLRIEIATDTEQLAIERQIKVLERIAQRYFPQILQPQDEENDPVAGNRIRRPPPVPTIPPLPDKELGLLGERLVYERELQYVRENGADPVNVEWISQVVPTSPYDIKTIRITPDGFRDHYLEVKSSRMDMADNVYISANQITFFEEHPGVSQFVFVNFNDQNQAEIPFTEYNLEQLLDAFELVPLKYKLRRK